MNLQFEQPFAEMQAGRTNARQGEVTARGPGTNLTVNDFTIDSLDPAQLQVPPQTEFDVKVTWSSEGGFGDVYDTDHPDFCSVGFINRPGAELYVRLKSGGGVTTSTQPQCWSVSNTAPEVETLRAVSTNTEGNQTLTAELVGAVTGNVHDSATIEIDVTSGVDEPPDFPDNGDNGNGGDNGDNGDTLLPLPPGEIIGTGEAIALGGGLALLLVLVIALR